MWMSPKRALAPVGYIRIHVDVYEYIYIYVRIHKYVYVCIHIHTNMYIHIYTYICIRIYIHIYTYIYIRMNAKVAEWRKRPIGRSDTTLGSSHVGHDSCTGVTRYVSREGIDDSRTI